MVLDLVPDSDNKCEHVWYKMQPNYSTRSTSLYNHRIACDACAILKMKLKTNSHSMRTDCNENRQKERENTNRFSESAIYGLKETWKSGIKSGFVSRFVAMVYVCVCVCVVRALVVRYTFDYITNVQQQDAYDACMQLF